MSMLPVSTAAIVRMPTVDERSIYIPPAARAAPGRRKNIHKTRFSAASAICRRRLGSAKYTPPH